MFITKFDWLTRPITLYHKGELQHSSIPSSIISLIGYITSIVIGLYLSVDFFNKSSPTVFSFNRFIEDSGIFPLNATQMFNNLQFRFSYGNVPVGIDPTYLRIIGTQRSIDDYKVNDDPAKYDHWLYDFCNNDTDLEGIEHLYDYEIFNQSYCIREYYNKEEDKYYSTGEKNFKWPSLDHGVAHPNKTFYGILLEKCKNDRVFSELNKGKPCKTDDEIKEYVKNHYARFFIIDHYPDVYDYKKPFSKYLNNIDNGLSDGTCAFNHLNFNPTTTITHDGLFFDHTVDDVAYIFDQNEKASEGSEFGIYLAFYFWLQNRIVYYERTYKRIQDVIAEIQGMADLVIFIATVINDFVSEYTTICDTVDLLTTIKSKNVDSNDMKRLFHKKRTMFMENSPPKRINNNSIYNMNGKGNKNKKQISPNQKKNNQINDELPNKQHILYQRLNKIPINKDISLNSGNNDIKIYENPSLIKEKSSEFEIYNNTNKRLTKEKTIKSNKSDELSDSSINQMEDTKVSLSEFAFHYLFFCKKREDSIEKYENFRMKIISEENLIQNYFDINKVIKKIKIMDSNENENENENG